MMYLKISSWISHLWFCRKKKLCPLTEKSDTPRR